MTKEEKVAARQSKQAAAKRRREEQARAKANAKAKEARNGKVGFFKRVGRGIAKWFRDMKSELKKVVWPSGKQLVNNSLVALAVMAVCAVIVWGFDELASGFVSLLLLIGG